MSNTSRFASLGTSGQVSGDALASAVAAMSGDELKAMLSEEQKAALAPAPEAPPAASGADDAKPKKKGKPENCNEDEDEDEGAPMAADRSTIVFASEHCKGRERLAADCIASFAKASGDEIVAFLAKQPMPDADASGEGNQELADIIRHNSANLGAGGDAVAPEANHGWDDVHKEVREMRG